MIYGYKEIRKMRSDDLRRLCIERKWYTEGNWESYERLLTKVDDMENITSDEIVEIATDIYSNSTFDNLENDGFTIKSIFCNIMFKLSKICVSTFVEMS